MGEGSPGRVRTPTGAVFLSYASQDADAAQRICDALRTASIEVWFDKSALRGGDAWDRMIRQQIRDCARFIPLISQHSQERRICRSDRCPAVMRWEPMTSSGPNSGALARLVSSRC